MTTSLSRSTIAPANTSAVGNGPPRLLATASAALPAALSAAIRRGDDIWLLSAAMAIVSFSLLQRQMGLDLIGVSKLAIRLAAATWLGGLWWLRCVRAWQQTSLRCERLHGLRCNCRSRWLTGGCFTTPIMLPWLAFLAWSMITLLYSPLKIVSAGQWLGLAALILMAGEIAVRRLDPVTTIVRLYAVLVAYCVMVLVVHAIDPNASGINRDILNEGTTGFVHPTAAGATSSLAALLGVLIGLFGWTRRHVLLSASLAINLAVLYLSSSRASLGMLAITLTLAVVFVTSWRLRGRLMLIAGVALVAAMLIAPGGRWLDDRLDGIESYLMRGQSTDQLQQASGRAEMWTAVWDQYLDSPLVGHGYFVTSAKGELDVWNRLSNHDAHHLILQVLVSTGIVGAALFLWALWRPAVYLFRRLPSPFRNPPTDHPEQPLLAIFTLTAIWFAGWSQTCVTFLGPIRPESVVFFTLLGLLSADQINRSPELPPHNNQ